MPVLRTCRWWCGMSDFKPRLESATPHHQRRPLQRGRWHRQKDKNRSPLHGEKPLMTKWIIGKKPCQMVDTQYGIAIMGGREVSKALKIYVFLGDF